MTLKYQVEIQWLYTTLIAMLFSTKFACSFFSGVLSFLCGAYFEKMLCEWSMARWCSRLISEGANLDGGSLLAAR